MPRSNRSDASTPGASVSSSTDSVNSTLPSPKNEKHFLSFKPQPSPFQVKSPSGASQPGVERMSTLAQPRHLSLSPPSSPYKPSTNEGILKASSPRSPRRYRPYTPRSGPIPPGLCYAAQSLGLSTPADLSLDEVEEKRDIFIDALSAMPDRILQTAFDYKQADHDCIALRLALTTAEIKSSEKRITFLSAVNEQHGGDFAVSGTGLKILNRVLGPRSLMEVANNKRYRESERVAQLSALAIAQAQLAQMYDVIGPGCSRWLNEENGGSTPLDSDDEDEDVDDEEGVDE